MKPKTNKQIVRDILDNSQYGILAELFVMDALHKLSEAVAKSQPKDYPENGIVNPADWIATAKEIQAKLKPESR